VARELTDAHKASMAAGRARRAAEDARLAAQTAGAFSRWCKMDARLWAAYKTDDDPKARAAWAANMRLIPAV
jgi:hypothetical protein